MIADDIKVSKDGAVSGTVKYLSGVPDYDLGQDEGHYFPIMFDEKNYKQLHVGGKLSDGGFTAGKDFTPSADDPYLVIRVENCTDENKVTVYDQESKEEMFTLDFNGTTLAPPSGKYAIVIPEIDRDFGRYGKASYFYDEKPTINWSGTNGKVIGTFKWFNGENAENLTTPGNYYPLVLNDFYKDKEVTVNNKTAKEWEWIVNITNRKTVPVKYGKKTIAVLDFSEAKLTPQPVKINSDMGKQVMSVPYSDSEITFEEESTVEKRYTKSEINRMSTADLQLLATEKGIDNAYEMTGTELKTLLIDLLVN